MADPEITPVSTPTSTLNSHSSRAQNTPSQNNWRSKLLKKYDKPLETIPNIMLILKHHPEKKGRFTWDTIRQQVLYDGAPLTDTHVAAIAEWLGTAMRLPVRSFKLLEQCLCAVAQERPRDLLQEWLAKLPRWDETPRLQTWLHVVASVEMTPLNKAISRLIPVSMVARALKPGCQYRNVVIFEGLEDSGKSKLVRALAGDGWYVEMPPDLKSKEAHMLIQGAWVAEFGELDSLNRTDETRIKTFITMVTDDYIPKFANRRVSLPRRTIFIGTTNEDSYLKGQTGNTRFLPVKTGAIDVERFLSRREQLFAEALVYYHNHEDDWWRLPEETQAEAAAVRDARRIVNPYEADLSYWLYYERGEELNGMPTTWREIAQKFLHIERPEGWKDKALQMQIGQAMRALGWKSKTIRDGKAVPRFWVDQHPSASTGEGV
jgi:putative DNA primase/helicase